jgi:hypothetical protein
MSEHKLSKVGDIVLVTSILTEEKMSEIEILKMVAPVEIPLLRNQLSEARADRRKKWQSR